MLKIQKYALIGVLGSLLAGCAVGPAYTPGPTYPVATYSTTGWGGCGGCGSTVVVPAIPPVSAVGVSGT